MREQRDVALLSDVPLFAGVGRETLAFLAAKLRRRRFGRGEALVRQGEPAQALLLITSGSAKVSRLTEDGDEAVLGLVGPGGCIGEVAALDGSPRSATVTAVEPAETLVLARADLIAAVRDDPELALALIGTLAMRLRRADARLEDAYFSDLETRLARRLLQTAEEHGRKTEAGIETPLPLTQSELASMLGAGRPRVNGLLGGFQDAGLIRLGKGSFTILQPEELRRRAGR
jgi:CRP/FNR family cyclic AMP-dependent transcriptional regulator